VSGAAGSGSAERSATLAGRPRKLVEVVVRHEFGRLCQDAEKVDCLDSQRGFFDILIEAVPRVASVVSNLGLPSSGGRDPLPSDFFLELAASLPLLGF
jgi:hypothetical protein